ncbi:hypothetical protein C8Q80DRAFT_1122115 [Daedaleopsis nitida]|nr:hypothetical protein C8Q80DRAFT_1122115 [Daedaleopsis nitida]
MRATIANNAILYTTIMVPVILLTLYALVAPEFDSDRMLTPASDIMSETPIANIASSAMLRYCQLHIRRLIADEARALARNVMFAPVSETLDYSDLRGLYNLLPRFEASWSEMGERSRNFRECIQSTEEASRMWQAYLRRACISGVRTAQTGTYGSRSISVCTGADCIQDKTLCRTARVHPRAPVARAFLDTLTAVLYDTASHVFSHRPRQAWRTVLTSLSDWNWAQTHSRIPPEACMSRSRSPRPARGVYRLPATGMSPLQSRACFAWLAHARITPSGSAAHPGGAGGDWELRRSLRLAWLLCTAPGAEMSAGAAHTTRGPAYVAASEAQGTT